MNEPAATSEPAAPLEVLQALAELLGTLLLREVGPRELAWMGEPDVASALSELGLVLPEVDEDATWIEKRGAEYHDLFLRPEAGPLVQSLWMQGRYEGDSTVRVRQLAEAAAVEFDRSAARGAPVDHLGSLLLLWAATAERSPAVAEDLTREHLGWATRPLANVEAAGGFYGGVARATRSLLGLLAEPT